MSQAILSFMSVAAKPQLTELLEGRGMMLTKWPGIFIKEQSFFTF